MFEEPVVDICFFTDFGHLLIARDCVLVLVVAYKCNDISLLLQSKCSARPSVYECMNVCGCMYIYLYLYIWMRICTRFVHMYIMYLSNFVSGCIYVRVYVCVCLFVSIFACARARTCVRTCVCACASVCVCVRLEFDT